VSSNDRYNRSNRQREAPVSPGPGYDDEIVSGDQWDIDFGVEELPPPGAQPQSPARGLRPARRRTAPAPMASSIDGTAAQLDRLRRNIRQSSARPGNQSTPGQGARRPRPQAARQGPVRDDATDAYYDDDVVYQPALEGRARSAPAATSRRRRQPASRPVSDELYVDDPYDVDPYAGYDDYEDDFSEYDAPRRPARQARPRPQFTMPRVARPSLPPSIAQADLVNDAPALGIIGVALASLAGMAILVANRVESLAPEFATHVSASGILERFRDESALWNLPLMAAMFTLMNIVMAWFISPIDRFASRFVLVGALVAQFVAWVALIRIL